MMENSQFRNNPRIQKESKILIAITVALVLLAGLGTALYLIKTKPKAHKAAPTRQAPLVEFIRMTKENHAINVSAMGTVIPSVQINLKSNVSGEVIRVSKNFIPGGRFHTHDIILEIDPQDYDLAIKKMESLVNHAKANLDLESGRQDVAREELLMMQKSSGKLIQNNALALRKPQFDQAQAEYDRALVDLEAARLDRSRTVVRAPFNCLILSRNTHRGAQVSSLEILATIVNTDSYWVETAVPINALPWITLPDKNNKQGSSALIFNEAMTAQYQGRVLTLAGQLNAESFLAKILIKVDDPLGLRSESSQPAMILDDYVKVRIEGKALDQIIALPRSALRDNSQVWVLEKDRLFIRQIQTVWSDETHVYISKGLDQGDLVITSNLSGVIDGMNVRSNTGSEDSQS